MTDNKRREALEALDILYGQGCSSCGIDVESEYFIIREALAQPVIPEGWQTIDTAPVDTQILVTCGNREFHVASFGRGPGLWVGSTGEGCEAWIYDPPTHWMPLPKPPGETK